MHGHFKEMNIYTIDPEEKIFTHLETVRTVSRENVKKIAAKSWPIKILED